MPCHGSYCAAAISSAGAVAAGAEMRKLAKYDSLATYHTFVPVAIESLGVIGTLSMAFLKDVSRRIRQRTGEVKAHQYLLQRLLVAVQRGNAISVMGSMSGLGGPNIFSV